MVKADADSLHNLDTAQQLIEQPRGLAGDGSGIGQSKRDACDSDSESIEQLVDIGANSMTASDMMISTLAMTFFDW